MDERSIQRYILVAAAHEFILTVTPFRKGRSSLALSRFLTKAYSSGLLNFELDAILLRTLAVLDRHTGGLRPTLLERYALAAKVQTSIVKQFQTCVEDVLKYRGIGNALVQQAVECIDKSYSDCTLTSRDIATRLRVSSDVLAKAFNKHLGCGLSEYLRTVRLDRASALLGTLRTVKEVWTSVGYNHASNFDRDFRRRFQTTPSGYRNHILWPAAKEMMESMRQRPIDRSHNASTPSMNRGSVMIVDDDQGTRETLEVYFKHEGYSVCSVMTGSDALLSIPQVRPDVVILDYHLPDVNGLDCLRHLRQQGYKPAAIIFSADWDVEGKLNDILALGASLLPKLCDLEDVQKCVVAACSSRGRV